MLLLDLEQTPSRDMMSLAGRAWTWDAFGNCERVQGVSKLAMIPDGISE